MSAFSGSLRQIEVTPLQFESRTWVERVHHLCRGSKVDRVLLHRIKNLRDEIVMSMSAKRSSSCDEAEALYLTHLYENQVNGIMIGATR